MYDCSGIDAGDKKLTNIDFPIPDDVRTLDLSYNFIRQTKV